MIRYKSNGNITYFASSTGDDNNIEVPTISDNNKGHKKICVKYHNSTTSYGLTTDTTASEYSPELRYNGSRLYFGKINLIKDLVSKTKSTYSITITRSTYDSSLTRTYSSSCYKYSTFTGTDFLTYDPEYCSSFITTEKLYVYDARSSTTAISSNINNSTSVTESFINYYSTYDFASYYSSIHVGNCCVLQPNNDILYYITDNNTYYHNYFLFPKIDYTRRTTTSGGSVSNTTSYTIIQTTSYYKKYTNVFEPKASDTNSRDTYIFADENLISSYIKFSVYGKNANYTSRSAIQTTTSYTNLLEYSIPYNEDVFINNDRLYNYVRIDSKDTSKAGLGFYNNLDISSTYTAIIQTGLRTSQTASTTLTNYTYSSSAITNNYNSIYLSDIPEILDYSSSFLTTNSYAYATTTTTTSYNMWSGNVTANTGVVNMYFSHILVYDITKSDYKTTKTRNLLESNTYYTNTGSTFEDSFYSYNITTIELEKKKTYLFDKFSITDTTMRYIYNNSISIEDYYQKKQLSITVSGSASSYITLSSSIYTDIYSSTNTQTLNFSYIPDYITYSTNHDSLVNIELNTFTINKTDFDIYATDYYAKTSKITNGKFKGLSAFNFTYGDDTAIRIHTAWMSKYITDENYYDFFSNFLCKYIIFTLYTNYKNEYVLLKDNYDLYNKETVYYIYGNYVFTSSKNTFFEYSIRNDALYLSHNSYSFTSAKNSTYTTSYYHITDFGYAYYQTKYTTMRYINTTTDRVSISSNTSSYFLFYTTSSNSNANSFISTITSSDNLYYTNIGFPDNDIMFNYIATTDTNCLNYISYLDTTNTKSTYSMTYTITHNRISETRYRSGLFVTSASSTRFYLEKYTYTRYLTIFRDITTSTILSKSDYYYYDDRDTHTSYTINKIPIFATGTYITNTGNNNINI